MVINDDHQLGNTVAVNTCLLSVRKYSQLLLFFLYEKVVLYFRGQSSRCMFDMGYTIKRIFFYKNYNRNEGKSETIGVSFFRCYEIGILNNLKQFLSSQSPIGEL